MYIYICIYIYIYIYIYIIHTYIQFIHDRSRSARSLLIQQEAASSTESDGLDKAEAELLQNEKKLKLRRHLFESRSQVNVGHTTMCSRVPPLRIFAHDNVF
jgi:hypothetical protein